MSSDRARTVETCLVCYSPDTVVSFKTLYGGKFRHFLCGACLLPTRRKGPRLFVSAAPGCRNLGVCDVAWVIGEDWNNLAIRP